LLGPSLLISPVTEQGATSRHLYLPKTSWYNFWTGEAVAGGRPIDAAAPLDETPVFVPAGTILPLGPEVEYAEQSPSDPIELRIFAGANAEFTLYEDEGDSYNYEKGAYATSTFHWDEASQTLTIDARKGNFPGMPKTRTFCLVRVGKNHGTGVGLESHPDRTITYSGAAVSARL